MYVRICMYACMYIQTVYLGRLALFLDYQSVCVYVYICTYMYVCMYIQTVYLGRLALILRYLSSSWSTSRRSWRFRLVLPHVLPATTNLLDLEASLVMSAFVVCMYVSMYVCMYVFLYIYICMQPH
jgi:hypothetical protein